MKRSMFIFVSLILLVSLICSGLGYSQPRGSIVGWGVQVVVQDMDLKDIMVIAAGGFHSLGLRPDGSILAWGFNNWGQCNVPSLNSDFIAIAAGGEYSLGLKSDGTIVAW